MQYQGGRSRVFAVHTGDILLPSYAGALHAGGGRCQYEKRQRIKVESANL